jgi:hypothetical protein
LGRDEAGLHVDDQEGWAQSFSEGICGALADLFAGKPAPTGGCELGLPNPRCNKTRTGRVLSCFVFGGAGVI